jgi:hypothetical protein
MFQSLCGISWFPFIDRGYCSQWIPFLWRACQQKRIMTLHRTLNTSNTEGAMSGADHPRILLEFMTSTKFNSILHYLRNLIRKLRTLMPLGYSKTKNWRTDNTMTKCNILLNLVEVKKNRVLFYIILTCKIILHILKKSAYLTSFWVFFCIANLFVIQ